ncbi:unnamed protein product [Moneuplotes crassus]|uniref:Uncharacterized protein n=1 Tax=Euplotes crassus TaxID=5936 RepID=A0AAD1XH52_EUPCR|nr:unnamed protein product [Moneuplotes crassus]
MEVLRTKYGIKPRLKIVNMNMTPHRIPVTKRKCNIATKLLKIRRKRRLNSPSPASKTFLKKRNRSPCITTNKEPVSCLRKQRLKMKINLKSKKKLRVIAKSPSPNHDLKIFCTPTAKAYEEETKRYMAIIKKVQDAIGRSPRMFNSPRILKKVLLCWESHKRMTNQTLSKTSPKLFTSHNSTQTFEIPNPQSLLPNSSFGTRKLTYNPQFL